MVHTISYKKTATQRFINWFYHNPDDGLTAADAVIKFGVGKTTAATTLNSLAEQGVLKKEIEHVSQYQGRAIFSKA